ncbi:MAG: hypothetical protein AAF585_28415, partial [Verrucomicrobiota bacterium]
MIATLCIFLSAAAEIHIGPVTDILIQDGQVFSCSQAGLIRGVGDDAEILYEADFRIYELAPAPGGGIFIAGGKPGEAGIVGKWSLYDDFGPREVGDDLVYSISVHSNDVKLALANGRIRGLEDPETTAEHTASARVVRHCPDGKLVASGGMDRSVILKSDEKKIVLQDHTAAVDCLAFSPDGKMLVSGARDGKVRIHSIDGKLVRTYNCDHGEISAIVWTNDRLVAGTIDGHLLELSESSDSVEVLRSISTGIHSLAADSDDRIYIGTLGRLIRESPAVP